MSQRLPSLPHLDHLRKQAKDILRVARHHTPKWRLVDAQHALARGYGFARWEDLKLSVDGNGLPQTDRTRRRPEGAGEQTSTGDAHHHRHHPINGTWVSLSPAVTLECVAIDDRLTLTQITFAADGRHVAARFTIVVDGADHPIPFGSGLRLRAYWVGDRVVRTVVSGTGQAVSEGAYEVSVDGRTLRCQASEQVIELTRCFK